MVGHWSPNFDALGFTFDVNLVFPLDRLCDFPLGRPLGRLADAGALPPRHDTDPVAQDIRGCNETAVLGLVDHAATLLTGYVGVRFKGVDPTGSQSRCRPDRGSRSPMVRRTAAEPTAADGLIRVGDV